MCIKRFTTFVFLIMNFNGKIISQQDSEMLSKAQNMYRVVLSRRKRNFAVEICNISCLVKMSA